MSKKSRKAKAKQAAPLLEEISSLYVCDDRGCRLDTGPLAEKLIAENAHLGSIDLGLLGREPDDGLPAVPAGLLDDLQEAADSGNLLLPTPAAYEELLASRAEDGVVTILRYGAPWIGPMLQELATERYPAADFYELSLVRNGKAAGERMNRHYKARGVRTLPYFEVYDGANIIDRLDASTLSLKSGDSP